MNHKVLLADDSLTIQKVIKITLANQPYEIIECGTEDELFQKLPEVKPQLVLLDFNLSEKYTGYELTSKILAAHPAAKVLLLLGTFDSIDDQAFEKSGASDKIVKPFDSNKFISLCKHLIDSYEEEEETSEPVEVEEKQDSGDDDLESQWTVSHSTEHKLESRPLASSLDGSIPNLNPLQSEISDWGMSIPGVIDSPSQTDDHIELPPVIGEEKAAASARPKLPKAEDLDYPSADESKKDQSSTPAPKSNLISIDSFRHDASNDLEMEGNYVADESDVARIEDQIRDEVEEDLWKADHFDDIRKEVEAKIESSTGFQPSVHDFDESLFKPIDDQDSIEWSDAGGKDDESPVSHYVDEHGQNSQTLSSLSGTEIEELIKKYVKEYMDEMFKNKVEKVAWEVIPDLAENLIRQELSKIADKTLKDSK